MFEWITLNKVKIITIPTLVLILTTISTCGIKHGEISQAMIEQTKVNDSQTALLQSHTESIASCKAEFLLAIKDVKREVNTSIDSVKDELKEDVSKVQKQVDKLENVIRQDQRQDQQRYENIYKILIDIQKDKRDN